MRNIIIAIALGLISAIAQAGDGEPKFLRDHVMSYECSQVDPNKTGFTCLFGPERLTFQWHEDPEKMDEEKRTYSLYVSSKLVLRYFQLGGRAVFERADFKPGKVRICTRGKGRPYWEQYCNMQDESQS